MPTGATTPHAEAEKEHLAILDTTAQEDYDRVIRMAVRFFKVPLALICWTPAVRYKFNPNFDLATELVTPEASFCRELLEPGAMEQLVLVPDTQADSQFKNHPQVKGFPHIRFVAAAPLQTKAGEKLGLLCLLDYQPRELNLENQENLLDMAASVSARLELQLITRDLARTEFNLQALLNKTQKTSKAMRLLEKAIANTSTGIIITDVAKKDYPITFVNSAFEKITGYTEAEVLGRDCRFLQGVHTSQPALQELRQALTDEISCQVILQNQRKDGTSFWVELQLSPVKDSAGKLTNYIGIQTDITARQKAEDALARSEAALRQAQKMEAVGQLAGGIAHDFNNLLTAITGYSELALASLNPNDPLLDDISEIKKAADRAASLTQQLLAFSRQQLLQTRLLNLNDIVLDMNRMLRRLIGENIELGVSTQANLHHIKADPGQLQQVLVNLAVNARDAMPEGGKLLFETGNVSLSEEYVQYHTELQAGEYVRLVVSDSGCGMDAATKARIFEPFFTTKGIGRGTGLGLATVYGIVKQSGGHIEVYSEPDQGSAFKVYLPAVVSSSEPKIEVEPLVKEKPGKTTSKKKHQVTVLLVEDEDSVRSVTTRILKGFGYKVLEAKDGLEALALYKYYPHKINLLLTDMVMPELGGIDLAHRLAKYQSGLKIVYMSGYSDHWIAYQKDLDQNVLTHFIHKPFTSQGLHQKLQEVLAD